MNCKQFDDGIACVGSGTHDLFPAIQARDLNRVRTAIDQGENIHAILGGTDALGWAFFVADASIVQVLIDAGVDVNFRPHGFMTSIASCALSLPDDDAYEVAIRLLAKGKFERHEIEYAAQIAASKRPKLCALLKEYLVS